MKLKSVAEVTALRDAGWRLQELIRVLDLTHREFGVIVGRPTGNITNVLKGKERVPPVWYARLERAFPAMNTVWMKTGEGYMFLLNREELEVIAGKVMGYGWRNNNGLESN